MREIRELKLHAAHCQQRVKERRIPDSVLTTLQSFDSRRWMLVTFTVRTDTTDTGKFVALTFERTFPEGRDRLSNDRLARHSADHCVERVQWHGLSVRSVRPSLRVRLFGADESLYLMSIGPHAFLPIPECSLPTKSPNTPSAPQDYSSAPLSSLQEISSRFPVRTLST
mgnify:CR=1 FL=1